MLRRVLLEDAHFGETELPMQATEASLGSAIPATARCRSWARSASNKGAVEGRADTRRPDLGVDVDAHLDRLAKSEMRPV